MTTEHLHFSTDMLRRLGEELNPHADQGILALVRREAPDEQELRLGGRSAVPPRRAEPARIDEQRHHPRVRVGTQRLKINHPHRSRPTS